MTKSFRRCGRIRSLALLFQGYRRRMNRVRVQTALRKHATPEKLRTPVWLLRKPRPIPNFTAQNLIAALRKRLLQEYSIQPDLPHNILALLQQLNHADAAVVAEVSSQSASFVDPSDMS